MNTIIFLAMVIGSPLEVELAFEAQLRRLQQQTRVPIPHLGFRVLIVYHTSELSKLPKTQRAVFVSKELHQYLSQRCVGGKAGYKFLDPSGDLESESALWQDAMDRPREVVPWLIISTGVDGYEGPLPATPTEMLKLVRKYGG